MSTLAQDVRYSLRRMRLTPGFTATAVLSLALGIGANTAIFSLIDTVMLRMLPVERPEQLVELLHRFQSEPRLNGFPLETYRHIAAHNDIYAGLIGAARSPSSTLGGSSFKMRTGNGAVEEVNGVYVTGNYFPVLGVKPALGRVIGPADDREDSPGAVAVVGWGLWKSRYHFDGAILGSQIVVENVPVTIVGVAAREFAGLQIEYPEEMWLPVALRSVTQPGNRRLENVAVVGRLKPGVSLQRARAETEALWRQKLDGTANRFLRATTFDVTPAGAGLTRVRDMYEQPLLVLMVVVGLLLLIACANIASLLLARGAARQREMALRVSLGASPWRLARQVLTEALMLSIAGTVCGVAVAAVGTRVLLKIIASSRQPVEIHVTPDARVLLVTAGVALATGLLFGMLPALRVWGTAPASPLRSGGRAGETRRARLLSRGLVAAQVGFSLVMLAAAGLFLGHLANLYSGLGFDRQNILLMSLEPSQSGYGRDQLAQRYRELLERLPSIRGVRSATFSAVTPISGAGANRDATVEGYQAKPGELRFLEMNWVAPHFFATYGTPLLAGRDFTFEDEGRPRVGIVNRTMARYFFGDGSAIGKHVVFDGDAQPVEIVGVVGDAKYTDVGEPEARLIYLNMYQQNHIYSAFSIRTSGSPVAVAADARRLVAQVMKNVPVTRTRALSDQVDAALVPERLVALLAAVFGALGALLAAVGLYGLLAYTVARRTNEIGVRMALGATRGDVLRMVLWDALGMVTAGLALGIPAAIWGRQFAASVLAGLPVADVWPVAIGAMGILFIGLLAAYLPALRASRVDPMEALRYE